MSRKLMGELAGLCPPLLDFKKEGSNCQTEDSFEKLSPSLDCGTVEGIPTLYQCVHILLETECKNGNCGRIAPKNYLQFILFSVIIF